MALILCVETSSKNCSVSISRNGLIINFKEKVDENYCHGEQLHSLIKELLIESNIDIYRLDALAFSCGPGSYTGLRIGAAAVKGLAVVLKKDVILIPTLKSMAWNILENDLFDARKKFDLLCPVLDSRRGEVYSAIYKLNLHPLLAPSPCFIKDSIFLDYLEKNKVCFFGPGKHKLEQEIQHKNALFIDNIFTSSKYLGALAESSFQKQDFADIAYFEPLYLKDFFPTKGKN